MPVATPFHERTATLCHSMRWKEWAGYHAVCSFDTCHEREYFAFRHAAGLIDLSPLYKYEVHGKDAGAYLARVLSRDVRNLDENQVTYLCWCDDDGKVIDDGTVTRLGEDYYRITAAEPSLSWFERHARGFEVTIEDSSSEIACLGLQGPNSRAILAAVTDADMDSLKFFRGLKASMEGFKVYISRTGYSGDLGYEIWTDNQYALPLWDALMEAGQDFGIEPAGLDAYDVARIEAGFIMNGVDYFSANHCIIDSRKSTPFEINLGWTVKLDREPFIGQEALRQLKKNPEWSFVGLDIDWPELEELCNEFNLPPQVPHGAWRTPVPIYSDGRQVGFATSGAFSPTLKRNLALAHIRSPFARIGQRLQIEWTVEFQRRTVTATVSKMPFFNPERKRSTPNGK